MTPRHLLAATLVRLLPAPTAQEVAELLAIRRLAALTPRRRTAPSVFQSDMTDEPTADPDPLWWMDQPYDLRPAWPYRTDREGWG